MLTKLLVWLVVGGIVGWLVSLVTGRDFRGGCFGYVAVGMVTMLLIGLLFAVFKILAIILLVALGIGVIAWVLSAISGR